MRGVNTLASLYRPSLAALTDLYQLTMAYGYWRAGVHAQRAAFHMFFRSNPFGGGYTVAAGLGDVADYVDGFRFETEDLDHLAGMRGSDDKPLFDEGFLEALSALELSCDLDAVPEGTAVFPHEPLVRVRGPVMEAQLLETALLNLVGFQSLIATKSARIVQAAGDQPVVEFGLRRAQGIDGALSASRAAYVGGCAGTSSVLASRLHGIPAMGTMAHSWVMFFGSEEEAFERYAEALPNNCVFLVDTYDSIEGVRRAIETGRRLRARGQQLMGIRLDSGDLAYLSIEARRLLDEAGFEDTRVVASNDLDESIVSSLKEQGARIDVWGIGTRLVTAYEQPALGIVYKMTAVEQPSGRWEDRIKLSEQQAKISTPGVLQVTRFRQDGMFAGDVIHDENRPPSDPPTLVDPMDMTRTKTLDPDASGEPLLQPLFRAGKRVAGEEPLKHARERVREDLHRLHPAIRRFIHPHQYPVGLEPGLHERRMQLIVDARRRG